jgi:hypothetical protein
MSRVKSPGLIRRRMDNARERVQSSVRVRVMEISVFTAPLRRASSKVLPGLLLLATVVGPEDSAAQSLAAARVGVSVPAVDPRSKAVGESPSLMAATIASAIVPGAGQALLHSRRAIAYVVAEAVGLTAYSVQVRDGTRQRTRYRELSRTVARSQFTPNGPAGDWDYYERMEKFAASGAYDVVPGGAIEPEPNPATYNGSVWLLAGQTYWQDPAVTPGVSSPQYQAALTFYERRAVQSDLQWSWVGSADGFQEFRRAIAGSNNAFRRAEQTLGLIIANHILSAVDAFVSARLRAGKSADGRTSLSAAIPVGSGH